MKTTGGLWWIYLFFLASLGPLMMYSANAHRMMIGPAVSGILILFLILAGIRFLLLLVFRRPEFTDPVTAILGIGILYSCYFSGNLVLFLMLLVTLILLIRQLAISPEFRVNLPRFLCLLLGLANALIIFNVFRNDIWSGRSELRALLEEHYPPLSTTGLQPALDRPDIYFIIFDRYARSDQLAERYDFDNRPFLKSLQRRGFLISERSYSAYQRTGHSVASTLNLDYLPALKGRHSCDWLPLFEVLQSPRLYSFLKSAGYRVFTAGSWWEPTRSSPSADRNFCWFTTPDILRTLVDQSLILRGLAWLGVDVMDPRYRHWMRIQRKFRMLEEIPATESPMFVFAHFLVPHPPFVIDHDGSFKSVEEARNCSRRDNYIGQLEYTNSAILQLVDVILEQRPNSVIVLQSDEGPWPEKYAGEEIARFGNDVTNPDWTSVTGDELREKMAILNAIYLPGKPQVVIGENFSPVNTFRLILREYFDQPLEDLPVKTLVFPDNRSLWQFVDVKNKLESE